MPRKLKLTPRQSAILTMLEEAGAEAFDAIFPTVEPQDIDGLEREVEVLHQLGLVDYYMDLGSAETRYTVMGHEEIDRLPPLRGIYRQEASRVHGLLITDSGRKSLAV